MGSQVMDSRIRQVHAIGLRRGNCISGYWKLDCTCLCKSSEWSYTLQFLSSSYWQLVLTSLGKFRQWADKWELWTQGRALGRAQGDQDALQQDFNWIYLYHIYTLPKPPAPHRDSPGDASNQLFSTFWTAFSFSRFFQPSSIQVLTKF